MIIIMTELSKHWSKMKEKYVRKRNLNKFGYVLGLKFPLLLLIIMFFVYLKHVSIFGWFHPSISHIYQSLIKRDKIMVTNSLCVSETINNGVSYNEVDILISDCSFSRLSPISGNGGVIYVCTQFHSMYVSYSTFYNCMAYWGGAIYFYSTNSSQKMVCAFGCNSERYHFAFLSAQENNILSYLSVSRCSSIADYEYSLSFDAGIQKANNLNCSMNNAKKFSGIGIENVYTFTGSYCTFSNNFASEDSCIIFHRNSGE